jgi:hypothetical protein
MVFMSIKSKNGIFEKKIKNFHLCDSIYKYQEL